MDDEIQQLFEDAKAMHRIAVYYLGEEYGTISKPQLAIYWLRRAAALNFVPAIFELGECYKRGFGVPMNEMLAYNQYRRCKHLKGFEDLSYDQRKVVEDGIVRFEEMQKQAVISRWQNEESVLREKFPKTWKWQSILRKMEPTLICCLSDAIQSKVAVSAVIHINNDSKTVVAFIEPDLDWLGMFESDRYGDEVGKIAELRSDGESRIVRSGSIPEVSCADVAFGICIRFLPTQCTYLMFPWHKERLDEFNGIKRWIFCSVSGECARYALGFNSAEEFDDYLNETFPWMESDFPRLVAPPDQIGCIMVHNPHRGEQGETSTKFVPLETAEDEQSDYD